METNVQNLFSLQSLKLSLAVLQSHGLRDKPKPEGEVGVGGVGLHL